MLAGDFNEYSCECLSEKKGGAPASIRRYNIFREMINSCQLMDLGSVGAKFTWRCPISTLLS
jgi:hypothetical protein